LQHVTVHVYKITKRNETPDEIQVSMSFVEETPGLSRASSADSVLLSEFLSEFLQSVFSSSNPGQIMV
jgi:hypothetical protein